jgi:CelD/BcsL family acetyltransferase involved in cellulose biosynthesis
LQLQRKARKLEREVGDVGFVAHRVDRSVLEYVIRMKSRQCRRTGSFDFLGELGWTVPLLERIVETDVPGFSGMLSVLYAGGKIAAAHLGMRSESVLHWWFPVYDPESDLARYSPGGLLLMMLAEHGASVGLRALDLGKGEDSYKASFRTGAVIVAEGSVETPSLHAALRHARARSREWLRHSPVLAPLRNGVRAARGALLPRAAQPTG